MEGILTVLKTIGFILVVIFSFNVIIFVHELGHFLAARWRGLEVERFQIWFGKPIWKKTINGVQYGLGSVPAGGFVALPQMAPMEAIEGDNESRKEPLPPITPLDKIIVAFAGPLFSFLLALAAAVVVWQIGKPKELIETQTVGYVVPGMPAAAAGVQLGDEILAVNGEPVFGFAGSLESIQEQIIFSKGDSIDLLVKRPGAGELTLTTNFHIDEATNFTKRDGVRQVGIAPMGEVIVGLVTPGGPADVGGFQTGDRILSLNGRTVWSVSHFISLIQEEPDAALAAEVMRGDEKLSLKTMAIVPNNGFSVVPGAEPKPMIGMSFQAPASATQLVHPGPWEQVATSGKMMAVTIEALTSPKSSIGPQHLSGPVGIGKVMYRILHTDYPLSLTMHFWVLFNVNLAIFNLLPFPVLDGGHITMAVMEAIRKKPLNTRVLEFVQSGFVALLLTMFVYVTMKDTFTSFGGEAPKRDQSAPQAPTWDQQKLDSLLNGE
ncbi:RIP metalloprotease RseP [Rubritalea marina]|uniref:RIP metalloprotease RseP n=1 Tax=Rubritalea marina TaxID=361055 RepID=UPI00036DDED4|nr:RIP metalloprotease RseP [Rubritalea marina]